MLTNIFPDIKSGFKSLKALEIGVRHFYGFFVGLIERIPFFLKQRTMNGAATKVTEIRNGANTLWTAQATTNVLAPDATSVEMAELVEPNPKQFKIVTISSPLR